MEAQRPLSQNLWRDPKPLGLTPMNLLNISQRQTKATPRRPAH